MTSAIFQPLYTDQVEALANDIQAIPRAPVYRGGDVVKMLKTANSRLKGAIGQPIERNDICPCGSGRKFKRCCKK